MVRVMVVFKVLRVIVWVMVWVMVVFKVLRV